MTAAVGDIRRRSDRSSKPAEQQLLADRRDERRDDREHRQLGAARLVEVVDDGLVLVHDAHERLDHRRADEEQPDPANGAHQSRSCTARPKSSRTERPFVRATRPRPRTTSELAERRRARW